MRYQLAALCLAAVLGVLPGLTTIPAAPAPAKPKLPAVYALVYAGLGKNDPDNAKWTGNLISCLRDRGAMYAARDPKVDTLPIIKDQIRRQGNRGLDKWINSKTRLASLEGTAVLRVWFTEGSPEEQAIIVNAFIRGEIQEMQEDHRDALKDAQRHERQVRETKQRAGGEWTKEDERICRRHEEWCKHPPHVLEWASPPEKP